MGNTYASLTPEISEWIGEQHLFFVATAPLSGAGLLNCSPKGGDSFRILDSNEVAYADLTGSGIETVAHLRENGRIVFMFCAFTGAPRIVRIWGEGRAVERGDAEFDELHGHFPLHLATRAIVRVRVTRVATSCGYGVPLFEHVAERDTLLRWAEAKGSETVESYRRENNRVSLEGLPGLRNG